MSKSKIHLILIVTLLLACAGQTFAQTVPPKSDEPKLIAVLKDSAAPLKDKIDACRQLAIMGGKDSIAPLAALLGDEQLSHMARYALETNPDPAADEALRDALGRVKGRPLAGVISSLGVRRDARAVKPLSGFLQDANSDVVQAAARAMGRIGTEEAAIELAKAIDRASEEDRLAFFEGLFRCAEAAMADGRRGNAQSIYVTLRSYRAPHQVQAGALRGVILNSQPIVMGLLKQQLQNRDYILFSTTVQVMQQIPGEEITQAMIDALTGADQPVLSPADHQILVIQALGLRHDKEALPTLVAIAKSGEKPVRIAALRAITEIGDESAVPVLVQLLDDNDREIAQVAQDCLATFPGEQADKVVMRMFSDGAADKQRLALDLMGRRRMTSGIPALVKAAGDADPKVRANAIRMIGELGGPDQLPVMLDLLKSAGQSQELAAVEQAMTAICLRTEDAKSQADKLITQLDRAQPPQKAAIVRVLGAVGGPNALQAVCACARNDNADVRSAAVRALGTWKSIDAAPSLLAMARETSNPAEKTLFLRGYLGLAARGDVPIEDRVAMCRQAAGLIARDEEKRLLLGTLSGIESPESVDLIAPYLDDAAIRQEAVLAAVTVSERLLRGRGEAPFAAKMIPTLEKVVQAAADGTLANRAKTVLRQARNKAGAN